MGREDGVEMEEADEEWMGDADGGWRRGMGRDAEVRWRRSPSILVRSIFNTVEF